jgi:FkbM family methyltransferase
LEADDERSWGTLRYVMDDAFCFWTLGKAIDAMNIQRMRRDKHAWHKVWNSFREKYPTVRNTPMESFFYNHGLRFTDDRVRAYVSTRDFIDAGSFDGDSIIALDKYTSGRIVGYELIPGTARRASELARTLMKGDQREVINAGLGSRRGWMNVTETGGLSASRRVNGSAMVEVRTIDDEVARMNLTVGFIKIDTEGAELDILKGAERTLREQEPVLSVAIYHDGQMIEVPKWIEALGVYQLRFHTEEVDKKQSELRVFAVPRAVAQRKGGPRSRPLGSGFH